MSDANDPLVRFDDPQGLVSLYHPRRWSRVAPPTRGASFACQAEDGSVLIEVLCLARDRETAPGERHLVDVVVEGLVKYAAFEDGMTRGRVISQNSLTFAGAEKCVEVLVAYRRPAECDGEISVQYFVVGTGRHALQVAMKTLTALFPANLRPFERLLGTINTPWMRATEPPNLSGSGHSSGSGQMPPGVREMFAAEQRPPAPAASGPLLKIIVLAGLAAGALWLCFG